MTTSELNRAFQDLTMLIVGGYVLIIFCSCSGPKSKQNEKKESKISNVIERDDCLSNEVEISDALDNVISEYMTLYIDSSIHRAMAVEFVQGESGAVLIVSMAKYLPYSRPHKGRKLIGMGLYEGITVGFYDYISSPIGRHHYNPDSTTVHCYERYNQPEESSDMIPSRWQYFLKLDSLLEDSKSDTIRLI